MKAIVQDEYGSAPDDVLRLDEVATPDDRRRRGPRPRARRQRRPRHVAHHDRPAPTRSAPRASGCAGPRRRNPGRSVAGHRRGGRRGRDGFAPGDEVYGVVRRRPSPSTPSARADKLAPKPANLTFEQAAAVPDLGAHRAAGRARPGAGAARAEGADHRRVGRRRHVRRADRQGVRRRGHRRVQHGQGGPGPSARRRPRHRLHARRLRRRRATATTRSSTSAATAGCRSLRRALTPRGNARHHRRRDRRALARRQRPPDPGACCSRRSSSQKLGTFISSENAADLIALTELIESGKVTPGDRPHLPAERRRGGHPLRAGRPRPRQGRHRRLRRPSVDGLRRSSGVQWVHEGGRARSPAGGAAKPDRPAACPGCRPVRRGVGGVYDVAPAPSAAHGTSTTSSRCSCTPTPGLRG